MNIKNNQRYQVSELKLQNALLYLIEEKPVADITVTEICQQADLNRTTFYTHYQDIPVLIGAIATRLEEEFAAHNAAVTSYDELLTSLLLHMKQNQKFYQSYFALCKDAPPWKEFLPLWEPVKRTQKQRLKDYDEVSCFYDLTFYQSGFTSLLRNWIIEGCTETPEEMTSILRYCLPS